MKKIKIKAWFIKRLLIIALVLLFSYILIVPRNSNGEFKNIPFLIFELVCALTYILYRIIKRVVIISKVCTILKKKVPETIKVNWSPNLFRIKGRYDIVYVSNDKKYNFYILDSIKPYMKHNIVNSNKIERFLATTMSVKSSRDRVYVAKGAVWHEKKPLYHLKSTLNGWI